MFGMGMGEWLIIFLIILLLFGAKRLPVTLTSRSRSSGSLLYSCIVASKAVCSVLP